MAMSKGQTGNYTPSMGRCLTEGLTNRKAYDRQHQENLIARKARTKELLRMMGEATEVASFEDLRKVMGQPVVSGVNVNLSHLEKSGVILALRDLGYVCEGRVSYRWLFVQKERATLRGTVLGLMPSPQRIDWDRCPEGVNPVKVDSLHQVSELKGDEVILNVMRTCHPDYKSIMRRLRDRGWHRHANWHADFRLYSRDIPEKPHPKARLEPKDSMVDWFRCPSGIDPIELNGIEQLEKLKDDDLVLNVMRTSHPDYNRIMDKLRRDGWVRHDAWNKKFRLYRKSLTAERSSKAFAEVSE